MPTKIQKWGNSQGIRLPNRVLQEVSLKPGDDVDIRVQDGVIVIAPSQRTRDKYRLEDLVEQIPENYREGEIDWGPPSGREVW